jgi:N-acetylated-alpha-linked acidic dipeptidase
MTWAVAGESACATGCWECYTSVLRVMPRGVFLFVVAVPALCQSPIRGFPPDQWKAQHEREEQAKAIVSPERIRIYMEHMAEKPHHAGSPGSRAVANYALGELKEWGLDAHIETFDALLPYPTVRLLEMTAPTHFRAGLKEPAIPEDRDTGQAGQLPTYNAYSASGDVNAPLVYVNYGISEDYEYLKKAGIDVRGKIVIARYGKSWRGTKPKLAQENGAVGCVIYSDPHEDGYFQNEVYPKGPMRPLLGVQRGSIVDMTLYSGDPLTPGWASEPGAKRLTRDESTVLMKIPVLPISYGDARPLLEALGGPIAPEPWRGALPITYHIGGSGPVSVHLKVDFDWTNKPLYDVIAVIPGSVYRDQWVAFGNHHDAWVNGATDPISGTSALLETARTLGSLKAQGWQPKRTIVLAMWDAEEFGLIGSTEWVEKHQEELERKAAVYINSDSNGRGLLGASGSHTLETFVEEVLRDQEAPGGGKSVLETLQGRGPDTKEFHLGALGSGSDYVPFVDHAGVASLNFGFGGSESIGIYHSIYDTMNWFEHFSDRDLTYGKTLSQITTTSLLRLADAPVLPFEFETLARTVRGYVEQVQKDAKKNSGTVDFHEVKEQLTRLGAVAKIYEDELAALKSTPPERLTKLNETLSHAEHALLLPDGLPQREWYRHQLYAPGLYTGYGAKTLPGVREAEEQQRWDEANQQARRLAQALRAFTAQVEEAVRQLKE